MTVIERIEAQHGRPFWGLVKELADSGESARGVARRLGMPCSTMSRMVSQEGVKHWFPAVSNARRAYYDSLVGVCTPSQIERLQKARAAAPSHVVYLHGGISDSLAGHARRLGLSLNTVYSRRKAGLPIEKILAPVAKQRRTPKPQPKIVKPQIVSIRAKVVGGSFALPCESCDHAATCAAQQLSCKAFARYVSATRWTPEMREPSSEWFARISADESA